MLKDKDITNNFTPYQFEDLPAEKKRLKKLIKSSGGIRRRQEDQLSEQAIIVNNPEEKISNKIPVEMARAETDHMAPRMDPGNSPKTLAEYATDDRVEFQSTK